VKDVLIPEYERLSKNNEYKKIKVKKLAKFDGVSIGCEIYKTKNDKDEVKTGMYGKGRGKDLIFESWIHQEMLDGDLKLKGEENEC
jgi:hypothetical protein